MSIPVRGVSVGSSLPVGRLRLLRLGPRAHVDGPELVQEPVIIPWGDRAEELREDVRRPPRVDAEVLQQRVDVLRCC